MLPLGVSPAELSHRFPLLFHMAALGSWPSIQSHGLLSTSSLLDLFEISEASRVTVEAAHRPESIQLSHPKHGVATVRDQIPMSDNGLRRCLADGLTPRDWYQLLNRK